MPVPAWTPHDQEYPHLRMTYFDALPEEACHNIVRHMSQRPRRQDWSQYISTKDVKTLYNSENQLAEACRTLFHSVKIRGANSSLGNSISDCQSGKLILTDDDCLSAFTSILAKAGPSLRTILMAKTAGVMDSAQWSQLRKRCSSVDKLYSGTKHIKTQVNAFGHDLRTLEVALNGPEDLGVIRDTCTQLRELRLCGIYTDLRPIWKACGVHLQKVHFQLRTKFAEETLDSLMQNCRALKDIHISGNVDFSLYFGRLARLYASYGEQLENVFLPAYITSDETVCRRIAEACPHVQVEMSSGDYDPAGMRHIGHLLRKADLHLFSSMEREALTHSWDYCPQLLSLQVNLYGGTSADVDVLQDLCRPTLEDLSIRGAQGDLNEVFCAMGERTGRLRKFLYSGDMAAIGSLKKFLSKNTALEQVDLCFGGSLPEDGKDASDNIASFMKLFAHARGLKEIVIHKFPGVRQGERVESAANACNFLRHSEVHVHICGVDYFP